MANQISVTVAELEAADAELSVAANSDDTIETIAAPRMLPMIYVGEQNGLSVYVENAFAGVFGAGA